MSPLIEMNIELETKLAKLRSAKKLTDQGLKSLIKLSQPVRFRVELGGPGVYVHK